MKFTFLHSGSAMPAKAYLDLGLFQQSFCKTLPSCSEMQQFRCIFEVCIWSDRDKGLEKSLEERVP